MIAQTLYQYILRVYGELEKQYIENQNSDIKLKLDIMRDIKRDMEAYGYDEIYCEDILKIIYDEYIKYWIQASVYDSITRNIDEQCFQFLQALLNLVHSILTNHNILWYNTYGYTCTNN